MESSSIFVEIPGPGPADEDDENHGKNEAEDDVVEEVRGQAQYEAGLVPHPVVEVKGHETRRQKENPPASAHRPEA
jgi:hypothetical protein